MRSVTSASLSQLTFDANQGAQNECRQQQFKLHTSCGRENTYKTVHLTNPSEGTRHSVNWCATGDGDDFARGVAGVLACKVHVGRGEFDRLSGAFVRRFVCTEIDDHLGWIADWL